MWFKNLFLFRLHAFDDTAESLEHKLQKMTLSPCGGADLSTRGWVPPKSEESPLVHVHGHHLLFSMGTEKKLLPASVVNQFAKQRAAEIEERDGYKPGRKQMRELRDQIRDELLPRAFAIRSRTCVWIDTRNKLLIVDSASSSKVEDVITLLLKSTEGLQPMPLKTKLSPVVAMTTWLSDDDAPRQFTIDQDCELKSRGEQAATVRYVKHTLEQDEIGKHIKGGKDVTRLGLTWADRVSFVLSENLVLKRVSALDILKENQDADGDQDAFDTDFALMTGELSKLIEALLDAMGGELKLQ